MYRFKPFRKAIFIVTILLLLFSLIYAQEPLISDFAGNGDMGFTDGPLLKATFSLPSGIALDKDGSLLVVDSYSNRIRKLGKDAVSTLAGSSTLSDQYGFPLAGFADGDALKAQFNKPRDIVLDSKGNIFVSDTGNNVIRGISFGKVYTFAGNGKAGYADGSLDKVQFNCPSGLAVDSKDNIYVADSLNNVIRKITPSGEVSTYCGKYGAAGGYKDGAASEALFNEPSDIAIDSKGNMYVLDSGNQLIRKISGNAVSTMYGAREEAVEGTGYYQGGFSDGYSSSARFSFPKGISVASDDVLLIADTWNHRIRAITPQGKVITVAGSGKAGRENGNPSESKFNGPSSVIYSNGYIYIADMWNNLIRKMPLDLASLKQSVDIAGISFDSPKTAPQIWYNKTKLEVPENSVYFIKDKTIVPVKQICDALGFKITETKEKSIIQITNGKVSKDFRVDDEHLIVRDGVMTIQLRYLVESFNYSIDWVQKYRAIVIVPSEDL